MTRDSRIETGDFGFGGACGVLGTVDAAEDLEAGGPDGRVLLEGLLSTPPESRDHPNHHTPRVTTDNPSQTESFRVSIRGPGGGDSEPIRASSSASQPSLILQVSHH